MLGSAINGVAEKNVLKRRKLAAYAKGAYRFADLIGFLADHGFHLYGALRLPRTKALAAGASIMGAVFVNERLQAA